jgi:hypothetical protein
MILNFLQTRDPPILPSLHKLPDREIDKATGKQSLSSFADDLEKLRGFGKANSETLGQLLFHFFRLYGHEVDYEKVAISVRQGERIKREEKNWHPGGGQKEGANRLCVEEPFSTDRNLGNSADDYAWRGIHLEIRRAFDLLADGQQLEKACEQYEFPAQEQPSTESIFKKPTSQKATITSSVPTRNGRGGSNHRGGRGGFTSRNPNPTGRRASGSNSYIQGRPPFLHSPPIPASPGPEYFTFPRAMNDPLQLHDHLAQQYQMLEMQSNSLRAQLAAQQHAQQAHQVRAAQMHAHAVAQAQAQNRPPNGGNGSPQKSPYMNGNSSPRMGELALPPGSLPQGFLYHYPGFFNPSQAPDSASQDGTRTNPSSPSLSNSIPGLRRQIHRASNASETASLRSHSQPPRGGVPQPIPIGYPGMPQFFDPATATFAGYPIARSTPQDAFAPQSTTEVRRSPPSTRPEPAKTVVPQKAPGIATPKEYVGYYVAEPPQPRQLQDYVVGPIPTFSELAQRRRRVSPEITQPLLNTALRRVSRSPSPLGHMRSYSTQVHNGQSNEQRMTRLDTLRPHIDNGPIIVNGSFPMPPREHRLRSDTIESLPPDLSKTQPGLGIFAANQHAANQHAVHQINELHMRQQMVLEEMQRQKAAVAEAMSPAIVNGSTRSSPSVESNGLSRVSSEGQQPFPTLPEGWMNYEASNGQHNNHVEELSPKRTLPPQWRTAAYSNGLPSLDTSNVPRAHPQEIKSATLPLLSPVFETRTPSPTANRSHDLNKLVNGTKGHAKENNQQHGRAPHLTPINPNPGREHRNGQQKSKGQHAHDSGSKSAGTNNSSPWQQPPNRKGKAGGRKKTKPSEQKTTGEPLPANAAERKGG